MKKTIIISAIALAMAAAPAMAGNNNGPKGGNATAVAGAAAIAGAASSSSVRSTNLNANLLSSKNSVTVNEAEIPRFTGSATVVFGSMVNDRCGRVALGVPYSAHTCNIVMEAQEIAAMVAPVYGEKKAYMAGIRHLAENDKTMRNTLVRAGLVELK